MKALNTEATGIFLHLLGRMNDAPFISFQSPAGVPLFMEGYGVLDSGFGTSYAYSLMQSKVVGDDVLREPQFFFLHFTNDTSNLFRGVCPYCYYRDSSGIREHSMIIQPFGHLDLNLNLQERHVEMANNWMAQIKEHGFLD